MVAYTFGFIFVLLLAITIQLVYFLIETKKMEKELLNRAFIYYNSELNQIEERKYAVFETDTLVYLGLL